MQRCGQSLLLLCRGDVKLEPVCCPARLQLALRLACTECSWTRDQLSIAQVGDTEPRLLQQDLLADIDRSLRARLMQETICDLNLSANHYEI